MADMKSFLNCPICSETFKDPVSLSCHHSFCKSCLNKFWDQTKDNNCPVCKKKSSKHIDIDFSLKALVDSFAEREEDGVEVMFCNHTEEPTWFCEVKQRTVCHMCESPLVPLEQAWNDLKEKLKSDLQSLQDKQYKYKDVEKTYREALQLSKKQLTATKKQIRVEFEKLHQFLKEEEEARLAALQEEEEQKRKTISREMKTISGKMKIIQEQISSFTASISAVKQHNLQNQNVSFLTSYKVTLPDPQLVSGALIDVAKHLGNLTFRVWEKMKEVVKFTPVILDPNTAHPGLFLSDDLTSVVGHDGRWQQLPDNPERNTKYATVLGSEGFSSGKHSWEVEVGDHPIWSIGAARGSVDRKRETGASPKDGVWRILQKSGKYTNGFSETLPLKRRLQKIRVQLDCDLGEVSFYNPEDMTHIYTHKYTVTEELYPFFSIGDAGDAKHPDVNILQSDVSVMYVMSSL